MIASERYEMILNLIKEQGIVKVKDLAKLMNVTETTIRRDCEELEQQGKLIRVHGGAKSTKENKIMSNKDEKDAKDRTEFSEIKDRVCRKAATFVKEGDCIFLDGITTVVPMIKYLKDKNIKIVTNNFLVAEVFQRLNCKGELFYLGGKYIPQYKMTAGPVTISNLSKFNFDYAFLGCAGVDLEHGMSFTTETETMMVKEKAMDQSINKFLLIDSSKLLVKGFYNFSELSKFDVVICNAYDGMDLEELPDNFMIVS
ncbi:MAG: DeoR/GlpR family DNA-binding transcription regulator [Anaerostipes sp.]|jgi:DeoR/GlpR family transcriptional regulator of sugar metabolism|nr:DeoR/GlpR family DNA-binding transcription regulator [Anaerostipes sp.]MDD3746229.1 DeoR/GlpR family DNA-binding transcription regulator [Anaerostipes sp.]